MWQPWEKSTVQVHRKSSSPSHSSSQLFSCSSFKDIQTLFLDEPLQQSSRSPTTKPSVFHRVRLANSLLRTWSTHLRPQQQPKLTKTLSNSQPDQVQHQPPKLEHDSPLTHLIPGTEQRVVVYYTSLRVVRSTYDACKSVFSILSAFKILIENRDVSMDSGFSVELNRVMNQTGFTLPRVFIGGKYVGGAEEVKHLNETGELKKMLVKLPVADLSECHVCGGHRFVMCNVCDCSRKV